MRTITFGLLTILILTGTIFAQTKYTWNGSTGSWQTASNWNPNGIPSAADTAVVNSGTVTTDIAVTVAGLYQNAGTIDGAGDITVTTKFIWGAGTQVGTGTTTITSTGTGSITTTNGKVISRIIVIDGLLEVQGSGTVSFSTGAQVINNGTIDFQTNVSFGNINGTILNNGTIINSSAGGGGILAAPFTNNGTVNVQSGELSSSGGLTGSGSFVIAEGRKFRITGSTSTIGGNSISGSGTFELITGTLNLSGSAVTVASGTTLLQSSGTIGGDGSMIINGTFNWVAGTQSGTGTTTITSTGTGSITTTNGKTISRTIVIDGLLEVQGSGTVSFSTGAQVINNGTIDFQTNVSFGNINGTILNNGTLLNSSATGGGILAAPFTNNGTVNVQSGELSSSGGLTGSGSFVIAEGRKFRITGSTSTIGGNSISGSGTFELITGTLNLSGSAVTVASGTTLLQSSGTIGGDGSMIINGTFNWVAGTQSGTGTTTITSTGTGSITTTNGKVISRIIVIDGLLEVQGSGTVSFSTGAQVINNGTIDFQTNVSFGNINGTILNNGTIINSSAGGGGILAAPFTNNGTVNVQSGELSSSGGLTGSGSFVIAEGRKFRITGSTSTIGGNSISGSGTFELITGTLNLSGSAVTVASGTTLLQSSGTIGGDGSMIINGTFNWVAGTQSGTGTTTITSTGTGSITTTNGKTISRTIVIDGLLEVQGSGTVSFSTGAQVINNGTIDFQTNVSFGNINGTILNNGTFIRSTSTGLATIASPFANNGTISVLTGTLSFSDTLKNNLTAEIKGVGTLTPPASNKFINNGAVAPGVSPGILSINGIYPQTSNASLNIEIGGYQVGSERDSLFVSGQAQLDGTLNIQFIDNFLPSVGDVFTIMRYTSRVGQFSQVNFSNNVAGQIQYLSNGAQVLITSGGVNQSPIAVDDSAQTEEDVAVIINVLANDSDPDNDPLSINGFTQPVHGNAVQSGDSSISYTPALNYFGLDSLTYTIQDPNGATATAKVRITILPLNDPPSAPALILPVNGDTLNSNQTINFVWNVSSDPENDPVSYALRVWGNSLDTTVAGLNDTTLAFNNPNAFQQSSSYQWQVTASDGNLSTLSAIRNFYIRSTALAGVYTIGIGGDYPTINSAVEALETFGIGGLVTFNILTGTYDEQVVIGPIAGTSYTNQIVFQSQSGNPEDVILSRSIPTGFPDNYLLSFNNTSNIVVKNIWIKAASFNFRLIDLSGNSRNITLQNNLLQGKATNINNSLTYTSVYSKNASIDSITIDGNVFLYGSKAIYLEGDSALIYGLKIINNSFENTGNNSIELLYVDSPQIINNKIVFNYIQPVVYTRTAIKLTRGQNNIRISENSIYMTKGGGKTGIYLYFCDLGTERNLVANNFIRIGGIGGGINLITSSRFDISHNSVLMTWDDSTFSGSAYSQLGHSAQNVVKNNIWANKTTGPAISVSLISPFTIEMDFNNLFTNGNVLAHWGAIQYSDLSELQIATGHELNSLSINPRFLSEDSPHLNDFYLNNAGTPLALVTTDIDGEPRNTNTPDIGADEFEPQGLRGVFTIGNGGDFPSITSAVQTLKDTIITGPVTFNILPGTYDEQVVIDSVNRVASESPIVFQSQGGNPEEVVWGYSLQSNSSNYVVLLRNVSHLTFRNLTFKALNQSAGRLIGLGINTSNITIENNICTGINTTSISTGYAIINSSDVVLDSISIRNNKFEFGSYAIRLSCNSDMGANITVEGNECVNHNYWSVQLQNIKNSKVLNNKINNQNSQGHGIWLYDLQSPISATENRIFAKNFGMLILRSDDITGERGLIANNFIHVTIDSSEGYGLSIFPINDTRVNIYYNTIRLVGNFSQNASSMVILNSDLSSQDIKNNIIINEVGGYAIRNSSSVTLSNYNDIVTTGAHLVRWNNINYPDIASYQTATGQDLNSISANPMFVSDDDLHIKPASPVDGKGTPLTEVPRDIDNQLRSLTAPDIGADEYTTQRIIIKKKTKLNKTILPLTITRDSLNIDPTDDPMLSGYVLADVNVFIDTLIHTNLADLEISLTHNGVTDSLAKFLPDSTSAFIGTILDDSGLLALNEGVSPYTGSYRPHSPLSVFNGVDPEGEWVLEIYDRSTGNFGILDAWGIELIFEQPTDVPDEHEENIIPDNFELSQNYPNPFNPSTTIRYSVPSRSTVVLKIYDILGGEVSTLVNEEKDRGVYNITFSASNLASGIYLYQLRAGSFVETKKMILLR